ncbi:MAG: AraC family transcriptional regulator [Kiritimatiellae bacterium]|nr:AraC family transcriptional regulator [Kiritimatiellia bacterium]
MPKSTAHWEPFASGLPLRCIVLYARLFHNPWFPRTSHHSHSFWQIETMVQGDAPLEVITESERFELRPGDLFVLPPHNAHTVAYPKSRILTGTFKFRVAGLNVQSAAPKMLPRSGPTRALQEAMARLLPHDAMPAPVETSMLEYLLAACVHLYRTAREEGYEGESPPSVSERIKDCVAALHGRPVKVEELARRLGFSTSHISAQFKKSEGRPLKTFLDEQRAGVAASLLRNSDMNIGEIAFRMEFPDPHAFSRFCKRTLGKSPREFRQDPKPGRGT